MVTVSGWYEGEEGCSVNRGIIRGNGKRLLPKLDPTFSWKYWQKEPEAYSNILQLSLKRPTLSFSGGSYLEVPCRGALLDYVEMDWEDSSDAHPIGPFVPWILLPGQPEVVAVSAPLRRESDEGQLPTFEFASDGMDTLAPLKMGWKPMLKDIGNNASSWRSVALLYSQHHCIEQIERIHCPSC